MTGIAGPLQRDLHLTVERVALAASQRPGGRGLHLGCLAGIQQRRRQQRRQRRQPRQQQTQPCSLFGRGRLPAAAHRRLQHRLGRAQGGGTGTGQRLGGQFALDATPFQSGGQGSQRRASRSRPPVSQGGAHALQGGDAGRRRSVPYHRTQRGHVGVRGQGGERRAHGRLQPRQPRPGVQQQSHGARRVQRSGGRDRLPAHLRGPVVQHGQHPRPVSGAGQPRLQPDRQAQRQGADTGVGIDGTLAHHQDRARIRQRQHRFHRQPAQRRRRQRGGRHQRLAGLEVPQHPQRTEGGRGGGIGPRDQPLQRRPGPAAAGPGQHHRRRRGPRISGRQRRQQLRLQTDRVAGQRLLQLGRQRGTIQQRNQGGAGRDRTDLPQGPLGPSGQRVAWPTGSHPGQRRNGIGRAQGGHGVDDRQPQLDRTFLQQAQQGAGGPAVPQPAQHGDRFPLHLPVGIFQTPQQREHRLAIARQPQQPHGLQAHGGDRIVQQEGQAWGRTGERSGGTTGQHRQGRQPHIGLGVAQRPQHRGPGGGRQGRGQAQSLQPDGAFGGAAAGHPAFDRAESAGVRPSGQDAGRLSPNLGVQVAHGFQQQLAGFWLGVSGQ